LADSAALDTDVTHLSNLRLQLGLQLVALFGHILLRHLNQVVMRAEAAALDVQLLNFGLQCPLRVFERLVERRAPVRSLGTQQKPRRCQPASLRSRPAKLPVAPTLAPSHTNTRKQLREIVS
jgi:hypothetical protein